MFVTTKHFPGKAMAGLLLSIWMTVFSQTLLALESGQLQEENILTDREYELRIIDGVRDYIPHAMKAAGAPGLNIALAYKGRLIWEAGFGWADVAKRKPMLPETVYHSGSLGKTYTGTTIMHLVDRGVIALEDPINKHLPFEVKNPMGERSITVFDLMTHTSGLGTDDALSLWWKPRPLAVELKEEYGKSHSSMLGGNAVPRWMYKVGEKWNYSNLGLATLGLIVETANPDKLSFADYVQKHVMDPLGMQSSQYPPAQHKDYVRKDIWKKMSTGYTSMGSAWIETIPVYFGEYPAGGVLARPSDHVRLLLTMLNGGTYGEYQLLKPATVERMLSPQDVEGALSTKHKQGLIWLLTEHGTPSFSFSHAGGHMFGWSTEGQAWPELDAAVMVAVNQWRIPDATGLTGKVAKFVGDWIGSQPLDVEPRKLTPEWAWKVSYMRGALFAAAYSNWVGIPGTMPQSAIDHSAKTAVLNSNGRNDWNADAFKQGIADMQTTGFSLENVVKFWDSEISQINSQEAKIIYQELGGRIPGYMSALLPPEPAPEQ